jgi:hypothetical protein
MTIIFRKLAFILMAITLICLCNTRLSAQERKWGVGLTINGNILFHAEDRIYADTRFKPMISSSLGINIKREFNSNGRFKAQALLHVLKKKATIGFTEKSGGTTFRTSLDYQFFSADVGVNLLYENPDWRHGLRPFVGLSFASAYFVNAQSSESNTFAGSFTGVGIVADTPDEIHKWVFYPTINLGVSKPFKFRNDGHWWEWTFSAQLSPVQSFQNLQVPPPKGDLQLLRGHFHHLTFALNRFF